MTKFHVPQKHIELLVSANACDHYEYLEFKQQYFYPFKARFLRKYGAFDGYDKQILIKECWECEGTGGNPYYGPCWKCKGTGEFSKKIFWLERRHIGGRCLSIRGRLFHIPVDVVHLPTLINLPLNIYSERIQHEEVDPSKARKAALKLILLYEVETFLEMMWRSTKNWWDRSFEEYGKTMREMIRRGEDPYKDDLPF